MIYENDITWKRDVPLPGTVLPEQEYRLGFFFFASQSFVHVVFKPLTLTVFS